MHIVGGGLDLSSMRARTVFWLSLTGALTAGVGPRPAIVGMRAPAWDHVEALSALMFDAYEGTIDYEGEGLPEAREEMEAWFRGGPCRRMVECSTVAWSKGRPEAACLVGWWVAEAVPLVQYVFTRKASQRRGFGGAVLIESLRLLADSGHREVRAVITNGNEASEGLFLKAGFAPAIKS
jgi:GNAT superfamily N-acetyltransferase